MLTRKDLRKNIQQFIEELKTKGYHPSKVVLFGSYAKGRAHEYSDVDLAIWDEKFSGCAPFDVEKLLKDKVKLPSRFELHTYHTSETVDSNPFVGEILSHGISFEVA